MLSLFNLNCMEIENAARGYIVFVEARLELLRQVSENGSLLLLILHSFVRLVLAPRMPNKNKNYFRISSKSTTSIFVLFSILAFHH